MKRVVLGVLIVSGFILGIAGPLQAQTDHESSSKKIREFFFGAGGLVDTSSSSYNMRGSIGDLGIGNAASTNYQAYGGFTTTDVEHLEVNVTDATVDLGNIDASTTGYDTATFTIRNWLSHGYEVFLKGNTLTSTGSSTIDALTTQTASSAGTEQFGVNLVANTSPASYGADPVQVPDSSFAYGYADSGYDTANQYKFVSNESVATSDSASGQTNYTLSYMVNAHPNTEAGQYNATHQLIAVPTY